MLNLDSRILKGLDENEIYLTLHLANRLGKNKTCWPSNRTLEDDCGWHIEKIIRVKKSLESKGIISVDRKMGRANVYTLKSNYVGIYVNGKSDILGKSGNTMSENPLSTSTENPASSTTEKAISDPYGKSDNKVLATEALENEELPNEELNREKLREENDLYLLGHSINKLFYKIRSGADDNLSKEITKKIEGVAREIFNFYKANPKPNLPGYRRYDLREKEFCVYREADDQVQAYADYTRLSGIQYRVKLEKLAQTIVLTDWCEKLLNYAKERFYGDYDPLDDGDLESYWVLTYFYNEIRAFEDRSNPKRIIF
jgi:hypothetical protein